MALAAQVAERNEIDELNNLRLTESKLMKCEKCCELYTIKRYFDAHIETCALVERQPVYRSACVLKGKSLPFRVTGTSTSNVTVSPDGTATLSSPNKGIYTMDLKYQ